MNKQYCPKVKCKYAHRLVDTENPTNNTYVVINSISMEKLIQKNEEVVSSTEATI